MEQNYVTVILQYINAIVNYQIAAHKFGTSQLRYVKANININIVNIVRHV